MMLPVMEMGCQLASCWYLRVFANNALTVSAERSLREYWMRVRDSECVTSSMIEQRRNILISRNVYKVPSYFNHREKISTDLSNGMGRCRSSGAHYEARFPTNNLYTRILLTSDLSTFNRGRSWLISFFKNTLPDLLRAPGVSRRMKKSSFSLFM